GVRFGPEVLDDDLLQVTVAAVQLPDSEQRFHTLLERFADTDQDARSKGDFELASDFQGLQAQVWPLAGGEFVRSSRPTQALTDALQHDAHGGIDVLQMCHLSAAHVPGVTVRK